MSITLIAAVGANNELGKNNNLIWHIPEDMKFFKENTVGKTLVMGMNTFKSLPNPLPNRKHIVLTHQKVELDKEILIFHNIEELLQYINSIKDEIMVIGGAQIYSQMIEYSDRMLLTRIEQNADADTYFPNFNLNEWDEKLLSQNVYHGITYKRFIYTKRGR